MCQFKSGIILKNRVEFGDGMTDSHEDILESLGIEDNLLGATKKFVRAELRPVNDEWWLDPADNPDKWIFVVDQDVTPDWFDREEYENVFREAVADWWKAHVLVDQKLNELSQGYYRLKRCEVKKLCNDVKILLYDSSQVGKMYDSSQVGEMYDSSQVGKMYDSSQVGKMWGSSQVGKMYDSSQVGEMYDSSTARDFKNYPDVRILVSEEGHFTMEVHKNNLDDAGNSDKQ